MNPSLRQEMALLCQDMATHALSVNKTLRLVHSQLTYALQGVGSRDTKDVKVRLMTCLQLLEKEIEHA